MTKDLTPTVWGKPVLMDETMAEICAKAGKILDENNVPTEGRVIYNPGTGEFIKMPEKNKYPVTQPERNKT